ncbi:hypothetical protein FQN57_005102 [Myotisia sp. PD_48]|nr:hypothetical protein FQN57_005102 [Myotisia sp. PD_48]
MAHNSSSSITSSAASSIGTVNSTNTSASTNTSNPLNGKSKISVQGSSLKITPANSPILKPSVSRIPQKPSTYQTSLSLQTVIGTTTSNPNGFSCHGPSKTFALCAGSAAVLAELDENLSFSQRFFRAKPTATGLNPSPSFYNNHSTPPATPDPRIKSIQSSSRTPNSSPLYSNSPINEWVETNGSRTWSSRERIKAVTSVSLSPNGRFLAVGETGYNPRVLLFSTAKDAPQDIPLSILTEHSFGVRSLAFSPNSQFLASLGNVNDGFIYTWSINLRNGAAKLYSTNRCTSFVRDTCWMGTSLVTVGIRHVKVWRIGGSPSSPSKLRFNAEVVNPSMASPIALPGRNCLLGSLQNTTFTCVSSISENESIVGSDSGAICFLDDSAGQQKLTYVKNVGFGIYSIVVDYNSNTVWFGGHDRMLETCSIDELKRSSTPSSPTSLSESQLSQKQKKAAIVSMGIIDSHMIAVDSIRTIRICPLSGLDKDNIETAAYTSVSAHRDSVLGISAVVNPHNKESADFFTWTSSGTVRFWDIQGKCCATHNVDLEQVPDSEDANELKIIRAAGNLNMLVSGDRYGVIRTINGDNWESMNEARAHGAEVTDIAIYATSDTCLVASSGRDRMVQLFQSVDYSIDLIQTMDEHVAAVNGLLFANEGERLLSSSGDRTVIIRERMTREEGGISIVAFMTARVITLKASPVAMITHPSDADTLILSTIDRQIQKFDLPSGRNVHSFRVVDQESGDSAIMSSLTVEREAPEHGPRLLVGVSTTDKSIRVYDSEKDTFLTREFGHTEGVSDVVLLDTNETQPSGTVNRTLVSTGLDGVIMVWNLCTQQYQLQESPSLVVHAEEETPTKEPTKELTAVKPPLRRILSKSELAGFQRGDNVLSTPTPVRDTSPPRLRKKISRYTIGAHHKVGSNGIPTISTPPLPLPRRSPTTPYSADGKARRDRSLSPPSPKSRQSLCKPSTGNLRRASILDFRSRPPTKTNGTSSGSTSEFGSLNMSTEQVCRTLRAYRRKLHGSSDDFNLNTASELERELDITVRALNDRTKKPQKTEALKSANSTLIRNNISSHLPSRPTRLARRVPSTPNLGQRCNGKVYRTNSLDADGEG